MPTPPASASIVGAIGKTPPSGSTGSRPALAGRVLLKLEIMNPGGSIKDRAALQCLRDAERTADSAPVCRSSS